MKKYVLFFISAFLVSTLIVGGIVWGFVKTGKIRANTETISRRKIVNIEEMIRLLIPDKNQQVERWDIYTNLADYIEWDSLSLESNVWKGQCILSTNDGKVPMIVTKKLEPYKFNIYIIGNGPEYNGFCIIPTYDIPYPDSFYELHLKRGDYVIEMDEEQYVYDDIIQKYQLNGKIPAILFAPNPNRDYNREDYDLISIGCSFNLEKLSTVSKVIYSNPIFSKYTH